MDTPLLVNPTDPQQSQALSEVLARYQAAAKEAPDLSPPPFLFLLLTYEKGNATDFNRTLDSYQQQLETTMPAVTHRAAFEVAFDDFDPFYQCTLLYVGVFLLTCLAWGRSPWRVPHGARR